MTAISPPIQSVLELFEGPLGNVRFADIDAAGLASLAAEVKAAASELERQEEALAELRQGLAQRQEALLVLAQQALAYARVYAENDEALLEELNHISLPRAAKPRKTNAAKVPRDSARLEPSAEPEAAASASESAAEVAPEAGTATASSEGMSPEAIPASAVEPVAPRNGRKARGASAQRAMS
jgi:hypothetical protein